MSSEKIRSKTLTDSDEILRILGKIIASDEFAGQTSLKNLLRYVTEKTLKGEKIVAIFVMIRKKRAPSENRRILLFEPFPLGGALMARYFRLSPDLK